MASFEKRKDSQGNIVYRAKVRLKGHAAQSATFKRLTDAKRWAVQIESAIREGRHFKDVEAKLHTLNSAIERYAREFLPKLKDASKRGRLLDWWKQELGAFLLSDLTLSRIIEARDKLISTPKISQRKHPDPDAPVQYRAAASVNRYLSALSPVLTACVKQWQWMDSSPMDKVTKGKESRGRVRYLLDDERKALLEACNKATETPELRIIVLLAITTGARRGEISGLRASQCDLLRRVVILEDTKNGERRALPLAGPALMALAQWIKEQSPKPEDLIFPSRLNPSKPLDFEKAWRTALKRAGLSDFRFHDIRHSTASYLAMNGASLAEIAEIAEVLGHKTLQMVKRYSHLSHEHTATVIESMTAKIFKEVEL